MCMKEKARTLTDGMDKLLGHAIADTASGLLGLECMSDSDLVMLKHAMSLYRDAKEYAVDSAACMDKTLDEIEVLRCKIDHLLVKAEILEQQNKRILTILTGKEEA